MLELLPPSQTTAPPAFEQSSVGCADALGPRAIAAPTAPAAKTGVMSARFHDI